MSSSTTLSATTTLVVELQDDDDVHQKVVVFCKCGCHVVDIVVDSMATSGLSSRRLCPKVVVVISLIDVVIHDVVPTCTLYFSFFFI